MVYMRYPEDKKLEKWEGKAYIIGGINKDFKVSQNILEYDPER